MILENRYFRITDATGDDRRAVFQIELLPDCDVYRGHFPGYPVCPGACTIRMVTDCAGKMVARPLHITSISRCRLTAVATPIATPLLTLVITMCPAAGGYDVNAVVHDNNNKYMTMSASMSF
ncbi:MAG: beta-hydroxyacyl-ACP dehydratase [Prevotella sp.]